MQFYNVLYLFLILFVRLKLLYFLIIVQFQNHIFNIILLNLIKYFLENNNRIILQKSLNKLTKCINKKKTLHQTLITSAANSVKIETKKCFCIFFQSIDIFWPLKIFRWQHCPYIKPNNSPPSLELKGSLFIKHLLYA